MPRCPRENSSGPLWRSELSLGTLRDQQWPRAVEWAKRTMRTVSSGGSGALSSAHYSPITPETSLASLEGVRAGWSCAATPLTRPLDLSYIRI